MNNKKSLSAQNLEITPKRKRKSFSLGKYYLKILFFSIFLPKMCFGIKRRLKMDWRWVVLFLLSEPTIHAHLIREISKNVYIKHRLFTKTIKLVSFLNWYISSASHQRSNFSGISIQKAKIVWRVNFQVQEKKLTY